MRWFRVSKQVLNQFLGAWVSCLTPAPWGQQTNRVCLPVSSDTQSLDRDPPFISNGISSSEITSVTSEWPWWTSRGWWMMFLLASCHYWLPEWNGTETRVTRTPRHLHTPQPHVGAQYTVRCIQSKHRAGEGNLSLTWSQTSTEWKCEGSFNQNVDIRFEP